MSAAFATKMMPETASPHPPIQPVRGPNAFVAQVKVAADGSMSTGAVTEQILISGSDGKGAYAKVTGNLVVLGSSIGTPASVTGKLCLP